VCCCWRRVRARAALLSAWVGDGGWVRTWVRGQAAHDAALQAKSRADAELARTAAERAAALTRADKSDHDRIAAEKEWGEKLRAVKVLHVPLCPHEGSSLL
jgi:hypothetical protein